MPIEQIFEKKEDAPEWLHSHLVEADGKFVFKGETAAEVGNLKKTLNTERANRTTYEKQLKRFERFKPLEDADEDEVDTFLESWQKRGEKPPITPPDKNQAELQAKLHVKELKKREDALLETTGKLTKAETELREYRLWTPLRDIAIKAGVIAEDWEVARLILGSKGVFGFDDDGKIVVLEDGQPSSVSPEKYFKEVFNDLYPKLYKASGAGGSGASASAGNGANKKTITRDAWKKMTPQESTDYFKAGGTVVD